MLESYSLRSSQAPLKFGPRGGVIFCHLPQCSNNGAPSGRPNYKYPATNPNVHRVGNFRLIWANGPTDTRAPGGYSTFLGTERPAAAAAPAAATADSAEPPPGKKDEGVPRRAGLGALPQNFKSSN